MAVLWDAASYNLVLMKETATISETLVKTTIFILAITTCELTKEVTYLSSSHLFCKWDISVRLWCSVRSIIMKSISARQCVRVISLLQQ